MTAPGTTPIPATGWWEKPRPTGLRAALALSAALEDDAFDVGFLMATTCSGIGPALAFVLTL